MYICVCGYVYMCVDLRTLNIHVKQICVQVFSVYFIFSVGGTFHVWELALVSAFTFHVGELACSSCVLWGRSMGACARLMLHI